MRIQNTRCILRILFVLPLLAALLGLAIPQGRAEAAGTRQRQVRTADEFAAGETERLAIRQDGTLVLGRSLTALEAPGRGVWAAVPLEGGKAVFSTVEPAGLWLLEGAVATPIETGVTTLGFALATGPGGEVYAGSLSGGEVLRLDKSGRPAPHATLPEGSVWAMACDPAGNLYVNTGPRGVMYRIGPSGQVEKWFDSDEYNLVALAIDERGRILAGSGERGNTVLHHFDDAQELRALAVRGTTIYAATNTRASGGSGLTQAEDSDRRALPTLEPGRWSGTSAFGASNRSEPADEDDEGAITPLPADFLPADSSASAEAEPISARLYALDPDGRSELLTTLADEFVLSMLCEADGSLLLGTGPHGRIYRVEPDSGDRSLLFQAPQAHVTCLALRDGRMALGGTTEGGSLLLSGPASTAGTWTSAVYDSGAASRFGALRAQTTGRVQLWTRSGNDPEPGVRWAEWQGPISPDSGAVLSPPGRYLQLRAELREGTEPPSLRDLRFFHAGPNHKPRIESFTVSTSAAVDLLAEAELGGEELGLEGTSSGASARRPRPERLGRRYDGRSHVSRPAGPTSERLLAWSAIDADDDRLEYVLHVRDASMGPRAPWLPVNRGEPLEEASYTWDTSTVPDGRYVLRLQALDRRSNPAGTALTGEKLSEPVEVDNTRPQLLELASSPAGEVTGVARDAGSLVTSLEFNVDGGPWMPIPAADGLFDGPEERFSFVAPATGPGVHVLTVRATDAHGNTGLAHVLLER
jgi:hypothetical protein